MSKHTPAPWKFFELGGSIEIDEGVVIADIRGWHRSEKTAIANAILIAAAPDLLEALIEILDSPAETFTAHTWDKARAAIAKATGELK